MDITRLVRSAMEAPALESQVCTKTSLNGHPTCPQSCARVSVRESRDLSILQRPNKFVSHVGVLIVFRCCCNKTKPSLSKALVNLFSLSHWILQDLKQEKIFHFSVKYGFPCSQLKGLEIWSKPNAAPSVAASGDCGPGGG